MEWPYEPAPEHHSCERLGMAHPACHLSDTYLCVAVAHDAWVAGIAMALARVVMHLHLGAAQGIQQRHSRQGRAYQ
jgi:hypothetical protein